MIQRLLLVALLSIGISAPGHASAAGTRGDPDWFREAWRWKALGSEVGLPTVGADRLVHTEDGTTWARTALGVAWFDGHVWHDVRGPDLVATPVTALEPMGESAVLVVGGGRLYRADPEAVRALQLEPIGLAGAVVDAVPLGPSTALVLSESRDGTRRLVRLELDPGEGVRSVRETAPPPDTGKLTGLWLSRSGRLWLETAGALHLRTEAGWSVFLEGDGLEILALADWSPGFGVLGIARPAEMRGVWTWDERGVPRRVDGTEGALARALEALGPEAAVAVLEGGRVVELTDGGWSTRAGRHSPLSRATAVLAHGGRGIWVAGDDGVYWIDGATSPWSEQHFDFPDPRNHVFALLGRADREIWIGTEEGVVIRDDGGSGAPRMLDAIAGRRLGRITDLAEDSAGRVWMTAAGTPGAWVRDEGGRWRHLDLDGTGPDLRKISVGTDGAVWLVPEPGETRDTVGPAMWALRPSGDRLRRWSAEPDPPGPIHDVVEAPTGAIWFATAVGLSRYTEGRWRHWTSADGLLPAAVEDIEIDAEGRLWFAHSERGFGFVAPGGDVHYPDTTEGAAQTWVRDIAVSADGDVLWLATGDGLMRYGRGVWSRLDRSTGLPDSDLQRVIADGARVIVGTAGAGIASLDVGRWAPTDPTVMLRQLEVRDGLVEARWKPVAAWGRVPERLLRTRYRIAPGQWSPWGTHRKILVEVPGGNPSLEVQVAGPLAERGASRSWSIRTASGTGVPEIVLPLSALAMVLALLLAVRWVERSRRERSVRASERRYLDLLQQAPDVIFTVDLDGKVLSINEMGEKLLGRGDRAVRGERLENLVAPDSALMARQMVLDALEGQHLWAYVLEVESGGGELVPLEVRTREVVEDGVIVALQGIGREVSERQRAARALRNLTVSLGARRGTELFEALVEGLARELGVDYVLIGEIADSRGGRVRTVASWIDEGPGGTLEYDLEGTPCARVVDGALCIVQRDARREYPDDELLEELGADSYVGAPLLDSGGRVSGLLAIASTEPIENPEVPKTILRVLSVRVADELERHRARVGCPDRDRESREPGASNTKGVRRTA